MLTEEGKKTIERSFGAYDFEQDKGTGFYDARFKTYEKHLEEVFRLFFGDTKGMEKDRTLDIREELTKKEFGDRPLLSEEDAQQVSFRQMMTVRQAPATQDDTSARASHDVETRRLFRIFCINMPNCAMYDDFFLSKSVVRLSGPERRTTRHGACAGITKDGLLIQNNLFIP